MGLLEDLSRLQDEEEELKTIAHLYFSEQQPTWTEPSQDAERSSLPIRQEELCWVLFMGGEDPAYKAITRFLVLNLATLLHIRHAPVVVAGFHTGPNGAWLRPAGEGALPDQDVRGRFPVKLDYGPLGIPFQRPDTRADSPDLASSEIHHRQRHPVDISCCDLSQSLFLLTDHAEWFFVHARPPSVVVFPLSLDSGDDLLFEVSSWERRTCRSLGAQWGVLIVGCSTEEEASYHYQSISRRIEHVFRRTSWYCGYVPTWLPGTIECSPRWPYVLCYPRTMLTSSLGKTAALLCQHRKRLIHHDRYQPTAGRCSAAGTDTH